MAMRLLRKTHEDDLAAAGSAPEPVEEPAPAAAAESAVVENDAAPAETGSSEDGAAVAEDGTEEPTVAESAVDESAVDEPAVDETAADEPSGEAAAVDAVADEAVPDVAEADVAEADVAEDGSGPDAPSEDSGGGRASRGWWAGMVTAVVLVVAAVALAITTIVVNQGAGGRDQDRAQASDIARQAVQSLVTIDGADPQGNIDKLLAISTGEFRDQLTRVSGTFSAILEQGAVKSAGTIGTAAVESIDGQKATVLVTANTNVRNSEIPNGTQRNYRMVVGLTKQDGAWRASSVEVSP